MGCTMPCALIESASSCRDSWRMSTRGWYLPRCSRSSGRLASSSPGSFGGDGGAPGAGCATAGSGRRVICPSSASRPRPMTGFFWLMAADDKGVWLHFRPRKCCLSPFRLVHRPLAVRCRRSVGRRGELRLVGRLVFLAQHLAGQREVGERAARVLVVLDHGLAERRGLGEPHVARHDGAEHLVAEHLYQLARHLVREVVPRI